MTATKFGAMFGVTGSTVARWIRDGVIPAEGYVKTKGGHYRLYRWARRCVLEG